MKFEATIVLVAVALILANSQIYQFFLATVISPDPRGAAQQGSRGGEKANANVYDCPSHKLLRVDLRAYGHAGFAREPDTKNLQ